MYITFRCRYTGGHGRMYFKWPYWPQEVIYVCQWFSRNNGNHVVIAEDPHGNKLVTSGFGHTHVC